MISLPILHSAHKLYVRAFSLSQKEYKIFPCVILSFYNGGEMCLLSCTQLIFNCLSKQSSSARCQYYLCINISIISTSKVKPEAVVSVTVQGRSRFVQVLCLPLLSTGPQDNIFRFLVSPAKERLYSVPKTHHKSTQFLEFF